MRLKNKGFTLLELMIVIAIISILAVVMIPNFVNARNAAKLTSCKTILRNISTVVEMYSQDNEGKYPANDFVITLTGNPLSGYIDKAYICPVAKASYEYKQINNGVSYNIYCPTYNNTLKHRTNREIIQKVVFSPQEGVIIQY
jgi:prepilin-type N-terminal cleavage/methylation domain-containing protein